MTHVVSVTEQSSLVTTVDDPTSVDTALTNALISTVAATSTVGVSPYVVISEGGVLGVSYNYTTSAISAGASTMSLDRAPPAGINSRLSLLAVDPFTADCELRRFTSISGSDVTPNAVFTRDHSASAPVVWLPTCEATPALFGIKGDTTTNDWEKFQRMLIQAGIAGAGIVGTGGLNQVGSIGFTQPLIIPNHTRMREISLWTLAGFAPIDPLPGAAMVLCNQAPNAFTATASNNTFTIPVDPGHAVTNQIAFNAPYGETLPGGLTAGRVYALRTEPTSKTFTIGDHTLVDGTNVIDSATINVEHTTNFPSSGTLIVNAVTSVTYTGKTATSFTGCGSHIQFTDGQGVIGPEIDLTSDGAGWYYPRISSLSRVYWDQVRVALNVADLNGLSFNMQQQGYTRNLRVDMNIAATALDDFRGVGFHLRGQLSKHDFLEINPIANTTGFKNTNGFSQIHHLNGDSNADTRMLLHDADGVNYTGLTHCEQGYLELRGGRGINFDSIYHGLASPTTPLILIPAGSTPSWYVGVIRSASVPSVILSNLQRGYQIDNWSGSGDGLSSDTGLVFGPYRESNGSGDPAGVHLGLQARRVLSKTGTLNFGSIAAGTVLELTVTVTGAAIGDIAVASPSTTIETGLIWSAYVSATNTVTVRLANVTVGAIDPASRLWRVAIHQFAIGNMP